MDKLNSILGPDTIRILGAGPKDAAWKLRASRGRMNTCEPSPRTSELSLAALDDTWDELPRVRAG